MKIGKEPHEIMEEMERGIRQNQRLTENGLYEDVEQYENFYAGRQWEGVNAPNLEKPVLNFTYRVVSYCISMLVTSKAVPTPIREETQRRRFLPMDRAAGPMLTALLF